MSRTPIAVFAGLVFITAYIIAAVVLPDFIGHMYWALEAAYWCVAGIVWAFPIRWLMLWSVHKR